MSVLLESMHILSSRVVRRGELQKCPAVSPRTRDKPLQIVEQHVGVLVTYMSPIGNPVASESTFVKPIDIDVDILETT